MDWIEALAWLVTLSVVALALSAAISWWYIRPLAKEAPRELRRLIVRDGRVVGAGLVIASVITYALLRQMAPEWHLQPIPSPWTLIIVALAVDVLLWGVTADAIAFWRYRRDENR